MEAGFELEASKRVRVGRPPEPTLLRAEPLIKGMKLRWKTGMRRCWFKVQWQEGLGDGDGWQGDLVSTRGRAVPDLKSGVAYSFRVQAHNTNSESNWSQWVTRRVH